MDSIRRLNESLSSNKLTRLLIMSAFSLLMVIVLNGAVVSKYRIVIEDVDAITTVYTSQNEPETILEQQNIELAKWDTFTWSGLANNEATIIVNRAKEVNIEVDGSERTLNLTDCNVLDALAVAKVAVNNDDIINVSLDEPIVEDMHIEINRVTYKEFVTQEEIPCEVVETKTPTLKDNRRKTLKAGKDGLLEIVTRQTLIDNEPVSEEEVSSEVVTKPVSAQVLVGDTDTSVSKLVPANDLDLDSNGNPVNYSQVYTGKATAYSSRGRATTLKPGNVAMNTAVFPKGTRLYIKTPDGSFVYGYSVVKDTGHAVMGGNLLVDLFFDSYKESCLFGAKTVQVYVLN